MVYKSRRKFAGKIYKLYGSFKTKRDAQILAKSYRKMGTPSRIVKAPDGKYLVYMR